MRQIKFRGKRVDNGKWVEGSLITVYFTKENKLTDCYTRIKIQDAYRTDCPEFNVDPSTVSQSIDSEIYYDDIVDIGDGVPRVIEYDEFQPKLNPRYEPRDFAELYERGRITVIGNLHDSPSLTNH